MPSSPVESTVVEQEPETPPGNADEWSAEQWIDWLKTTDASTPSSDRPSPATKGGRVVHSPGGQVLASAMTGLARALYGPQEEKPAIVAESGEPDDDRPLEVHLDFEHPDRSYVIFRPNSDPTR